MHPLRLFSRHLQPFRGGCVCRGRAVIHQVWDQVVSFDKTLIPKLLLLVGQLVSLCANMWIRNFVKVHAGPFTSVFVSFFLLVIIFHRYMAFKQIMLHTAALSLSVLAPYDNPSVLTNKTCSLIFYSIFIGSRLSAFRAKAVTQPAVAKHIKSNVCFGNVLTAFNLPY